MTLQHPILLLVASLLLVATVALAAWRRVALSWTSMSLVLVGGICLALAAGGIHLDRPRMQQVVVMVDLSPSTRTADYRQRESLMRRIDQLLGGTPRRIVAFAQEHHDLPASQVLGDVPVDATRFTPPPAGAVLLFSDARFAPPEAAPPLFVVVDRKLDAPPDASVAQLELRADNAIATVRNRGEARQLMLSGTSGNSTTTIPTGGLIVTAQAIDGAEVVARLNAGDAWPENDALAIRAAPPAQPERWWIGQTDPGDDWRHMLPAQLPQASTPYLAAAIVVLDNVAASQLDEIQQRRLLQYVRDMGGAVVILGGDRAFAAGEYPGRALDALSPLSSTPPQPTTHWILLVDQSGSMSARIDGQTRWQRATEQVVRVLPTIARADLVSVGSFAAEVNWWVRAQPSQALRNIALPPPQLSPHGPTNLEPALRQVIADSDQALPSELLLVTDTEAKIDAPEELAGQLKQRQIRLHVLAIDARAENQALKEMAQRSGGQFMQQADPKRWARDLQRMLQAASPPRLAEDPIDVEFRGELSGLGSRRLSLWNRVWLKQHAQALAVAEVGPARVTLAARWRVGSGEVIAAGFPATRDEVQAMAQLIDRPPRDPRFTVTWHQGATLSVRIDAVDQQRPMNRLSLLLEVMDEASGLVKTMPIAQIGPGRYALHAPSPRAPAIATVRHESAVIDRTAVAARYPPEFAALGNDREAMQRLAETTGGAVIEPEEDGPITLPWPRRQISLLPTLSILGALFIALGLAHWRWRG